MGRPREGWKLRPPRRPGLPFTVRFTGKAGRSVELSTGTDNPVEAAVRAADLYARDLSSAGVVKGARVSPLLALDELMAMWLADLEKTHDPETVTTYTAYAKGFVQHFGVTLDKVTPATMGDYQRSRLTRVLRSTVQKERSALNGFLGWCLEQNVLGEDQIPAWPKLPKKALGVRSGPQREAPVDVTPAQVNAFLAALPLWSKPRFGHTFAIRARFIVAYETGLRPGLLDELAVPKHWKPGATHLVIESQHDKVRYGRRVPLTARAVAALEQTVKTLALVAGPVFGRHDHRDAVEKARKAAGLPEDFAPYDLRHGRAGHLLDASGDMRGVAFLLGHKLLTTTNRYLRGQEENARTALEAASSGDISGKDELDMDRAKEGSRTLTGVTPLEPESGDSDQCTNSYAHISGQVGTVGDPERQGFGDTPETLSRNSVYLAVLRADWDLLDAATLGWEDES